jgi:hypothetical protein
MYLPLIPTKTNIFLQKNISVGEFLQKLSIIMNLKNTAVFIWEAMIYFFNVGHTVSFP